MADKLNPYRINSWTIEQCIEVFSNMEYGGFHEWESELCSDYLDSEAIEDLSWRLAVAYVNEKKGKCKLQDIP